MPNSKAFMLNSFLPNPVILQKKEKKEKENPNH